MSKHFIKSNSNPFFENKRSIKVYDIPVKYTFKSLSQLFVGYLGPMYFNSV